MTAKDLIELLQRQEPHTEVYFQHPSHDYWRTQLASPVQAAETGKIRMDMYHNTYSIPRHDDSEEAQMHLRADEKRVLILRGA